MNHKNARFWPVVTAAIFAPLIVVLDMHGFTFFLYQWPIKQHRPLIGNRSHLATMAVLYQRNKRSKGSLRLLASFARSSGYDLHSGINALANSVRTTVLLVQGQTNNPMSVRYRARRKRMHFQVVKPLPNLQT
ncbi:hypothetical protein [Caballeronia grimmiae]|uniref:hypothetical protein n=1 Tax=Caballeronia grimmiae TaxID=1071679 RepID=UPI0038B6F036